MFILQDANFPALCKNSRGNRKLLGRLSQTSHMTATHSPVFTFNTYNIFKTKLQVHLSNSTPSMATMMHSALCFNLSTLPRSLPWSPGPGRISTHRTERLQKEMMIKEETNRQSMTVMFMFPIYIKLISPKQSSQMRPMPVFLILIPFSFLRLR